MTENETPTEEVFESSPEADASAGVEDKISELTADLQRVGAEFANYKKRVDRDRAVARETAIGDVLAALLPLLDDFSRAQEHGELTGAFKSVSDSFDAIVAKFGLESFGLVGENFDPLLHEAISHQTAESDGPTVTVITSVFQAGFKRADRVLRPARVAVEEIAAPQE